jgi:hypothetical protein
MFQQALSRFMLRGQDNLIERGSEKENRKTSSLSLTLADIVTA